MPMLSHTHRTNKKVFTDGQRDLLFAPAASGPCAGDYRKDRGSILFAPYLQLFMHIDRSPLSFLSLRLNSPSSLRGLPQEMNGLQLIHHLCDPLLNFLPVSHVLGSPELGEALRC